MSAKNNLRWISLCAIAAALPAQAAIVATTDAATGDNSYDSSIVTNLIRNGEATLGGFTVSHTGWNDGVFPTTGVNDGSAGGNSNLSYWNTKNPGNGSGSSGWLPVTITFDLAGSETGYDITSIQSIAGWNNAHLGSQQFRLLLSTDNGGSYADYGAHLNTTESTGANASTRTTLTDDNETGTIASGVTNVRFIFISPVTDTDFQGGDGGTVIRELQVFGTATVPEPSACGITAAGLALCALRRRRSR